MKSIATLAADDRVPSYKKKKKGGGGEFALSRVGSARELCLWFCSISVGFDDHSLQCSSGWLCNMR
jgi:hypothetical protein